MDDQNSKFHEVEKISDCELFILENYTSNLREPKAWLKALENAFEDVDGVEHLGEFCQLKGLILQGDQILAKVRRNQKNATISINSMKILKRDKHLQIWQKAYVKNSTS